MYNYINKSNSTKDKAIWENKITSIIDKNINTEKVNNMLEQRKTFLDIRKHKLANLLITEEINLRNEILNNQETPIDVRNKMEKKLLLLKQQREHERLQKVKVLKERKFYQDADELRKNDSEAFAIECYLEQENQMLDKLKNREIDKKEESIYVKLNELDIKKKEELEKKQLEEKERKKNETYKFLEWQKQQQYENDKEIKSIEKLENERIKSQWNKDNEREANDKIQRKIKNHEVYKNIQEFNKKEEDIKRNKLQREKENDKFLIDTIVNKEKALDDIDRREKERKKLEFDQNKKYLEFTMNQKKEAEAWMDRVAKEEADKKWRKEQEDWMKQENSRIELLKQVYKEREQAIKFKKNVEQKEKDEVALERIKLEEEIRVYNKKIELAALEDKKRRNDYKEDLLYQIKEKQLQLQKEKQDKVYEERAAKLWEIEYQNKINEQKEIHINKLKDIKERGMKDQNY